MNLKHKITRDLGQVLTFYGPRRGPRASGPRCGPKRGSIIEGEIYDKKQYLNKAKITIIPLHSIRKIPKTNQNPFVP